MKQNLYQISCSCHYTLYKLNQYLQQILNSLLQVPNDLFDKIEKKTYNSVIMNNYNLIASNTVVVICV